MTDKFVTEMELRALTRLKRTLGLKHTDLYISLITADVRIQRQAHEIEEIKIRFERFRDDVAFIVNHSGMSAQAYARLREAIKNVDLDINYEKEHAASAT